MCLEELQSIIKLSGIGETNLFSVESSTTAFNLSMMTRENELERDEIF